MQNLNTNPKPVDFPELEKLTVSNTGVGSTETPKVIVAGCHHDIGLTLIDANNKDREVVCLVHKVHAQDKGAWNPVKYSQLFYALVAQIQKGYIDLREAESNVPQFREPTFGSLPDCPFK